MRITTGLLGLLIVAGIMLAGCATEPGTDDDKRNLVDDASGALRHMKAQDATLVPFLTKSYGYVIFPSVGKGGFIAAGAYGRGVVYEKGQMVAYSDLAQATVGLQAGGQSYSELIVFDTQVDFDRFVGGRLTLALNISAVALTSGAAGSARYTEGVAVFVESGGGLMFEAAVGGQQFTYMPK